MTNKVEIKRLDSVTKNDTTATEQINDNFKALQEAIENTLSRDGTGPNFMDADLDMNSYRIINSSDPVEDNDIVNLKYVEERIGGAVEASKTAVSAATQAANSAQSALVSSTNAINTLRNAENTINLATSLLTETQEYVDNAKADIDSTVEAGKEEINTTIDDAQMSLSDTIQQSVEEVKQAALDAANEAINDAAATATGIVLEYTNNELKPELMAYATSADEDAKAAEDWAKTSKIWATGEDAEVNTVAPGEEEHSSRGYADLAMAIANTPENIPVDASTLLALDVIRGEKGDKGDRGDAGKDGVDGKSVFDGYATNCITEIPQDIKLELVDGVLTLKAGSKVYVPNGFEADGVTPKFDVVVIESDSTIKNGANRQEIILYRNGRIAGGVPSAWVYSGAVQPAISTTFAIWYDTTNNKIKQTNDNGSTWLDGLSLPIALSTSNTAQYVAIDQVFNGFGYIGSTIFALPGVKGLIPNGRNEDGSLRNIEFTVEKVLTEQAHDTTTASVLINIENNTAHLFTWTKVAVNVVEKLPSSLSIYNRYFVKPENKWYYYDGTTLFSTTTDACCILGTGFLDTNGRYTGLTSKTAFHAVDRNDSSWVSAQAMPSGKYIDLTLGASGSSYTAPANGYFAYRCMSQNVGSLVLLVNESNGISISSNLGSSGNSNYGGNIPVKKGDVVKMDYAVIASWNWFRFVYAEGEN